uniref:Uncharacterized protein n=1 Tax=Oryza sativa subsp. japonica TaxID=39947 RepID=Q5VPM9_ORYSJ|nr:hypothetical protein [Oryza sativa Japonica Group]
MTRKHASVAPLVEPSCQTRLLSQPPPCWSGTAMHGTRLASTSPHVTVPLTTATPAASMQPVTTTMATTAIFVVVFFSLLSSRACYALVCSSMARMASIYSPGWG